MVNVVVEVVVVMVEVVIGWVMGGGGVRFGSFSTDTLEFVTSSLSVGTCRFLIARV